MPSVFPARPWIKLGADLFSVHGNTYPLVVDYFSRFVEIATLTPARSDDGVVHLKCFQDIPEFQRSFSRIMDLNFPDSHLQALTMASVTSSTRFAQSNERHVQMVKHLLSKANDPYLAMLAYRTTPTVLHSS